MTNYLVGLKEEFLFYIENSVKIITDAKENTVKFISKNNKLLFFTKQSDVDFIVEWDIDTDEISPKIQEKYGLSTPNKQVEEEPAPEVPQIPEGEPTVTEGEPTVTGGIAGETLEEEEGEIE